MNSQRVQVGSLAGPQRAKAVARAALRKLPVRVAQARVNRVLCARSWSRPPAGAWREDLA